MNRIGTVELIIIFMVIFALLYFLLFKKYNNKK